MSDEIIYGTVGITLLSKGVHNVIVMADNHDTLPECQNKINVAEWFGKKMGTSKILLEEVPRQGNKLVELWKESPHTQQLKDLYLENPDTIPGMDIRPFVIPFSFEVLNEIDESNKEYPSYTHVFEKLNIVYISGSNTKLYEVPENYSIECVNIFTGINDNISCKEYIQNKRIKKIISIFNEKKEKIYYTKNFFVI
jgi:hypothetical protein